MKVQWIGHACFLLTSAGGTRVITDPYEPGYRGIINYAAVNEAADIVTLSHQHGDHNYAAGVKGNPVVVQGPGRHQAKGIEFQGIACFHDRVSGQERGQNTIFAFALDGLRVCHLGDLGHPLPLETVKQLGPVDILLAPTGGPMATLELDEMLALWQQLKPGVMLPMHFKTERCTFPKYGVQDLLQHQPRAQQALGSEAEFHKGKLPTGQILILKPSR